MLCYHRLPLVPWLACNVNLLLSIGFHIAERRLSAIHVALRYRQEGCCREAQVPCEGSGSMLTCSQISKSVWRSVRPSLIMQGSGIKRLSDTLPSSYDIGGYILDSW